MRGALFVSVFFISFNLYGNQFSSINPSSLNIAKTDEIVNFGVSSHDDCVDALVWLCNGLMTKGKLELEY